MIKKISSLLVFLVFLLFIMGGCKFNEIEITHFSNENFFTNEKINWFAQSDWGKSLDNALVEVGSYDIQSNTISLIEKKAAPQTLDRIFYNKPGFMANYTVSGEFKIDEMYIEEGIYNKIGFYAAYKDSGNNVQVFFHPLETEQFISVCSIVNGTWELIWKIYNLPDGIDTSITNKLEVIKIGSEFRVYFNEALVAEFNAAIDKAQIGLISEEIEYTVNNFSLTSVTEFPRMTIGWGNAPDEEISMSGNYDVTPSKVMLQGTDDESQMFIKGEPKDNYLIKANIDAAEVNSDQESYVGFYAVYCDIDNYIKLYFTNSSELKIHKVANGVEEILTENVSSNLLNEVFALEIYKISDEVKVFVNNNLIISLNTNIDAGVFGLYSKNVNVEYNSLIWVETESFPSVIWGNSYDGLLAKRGTFSINNNDITVTSTANGGYGEMEQNFYNGEVPMVDFEVKAKISIPDTITLDVNNKYGFLLYHNADNYLEVFIIPMSNQIFLVSKENGEFGFLWTAAYTFTEGFNFNTDSEYKVVKSGSQFTISVDDAVVHTFDIPGFEQLEMQAAITAEKTAPVFFKNFCYGIPSDQPQWGDSYDSLIASRGEYEISGNDITVTSTANGGYGEMEQNFYNGEVLLVDFEVKAKISIPDTITLDGNNKYGFLLYHNTDNYLEVFIIPALNQIFLVSKENGEFGFLWTAAYTFTEGFDFNADSEYKVVKSGSQFTISVDDAVVHTFDIPGFEQLEMQAAITAEKTAPVFFKDFYYGIPSDQPQWGDSYDSLIASRGEYEINGNDITVTSTANGGYGEMEQNFYNSEVLLVDFEVKAKISIPDTITLDGNNKYGFLLYHNTDNYLEVFIIPALNQIFLVSKENGEFGFLWTAAYTFTEGFDFNADSEYKVVKSGSQFTISVDDAVVHTFDIPVFEQLEMQAAITAEKTAPVFFKDFYYGNTVN